MIDSAAKSASAIGFSKSFVNLVIPTNGISSADSATILGLFGEGAEAPSVILIVQNDLGDVENANSLVSFAYFEAYCLKTGKDISSFTTDQINIALIKSTAYVDVRFDYKGSKLNKRAQTTSWPRYMVYDCDNFLVEGIPIEIKDACCEYAFRSLTIDINPDPDNLVDGKQVIKKTDKLDGVYSESYEFDQYSEYSMPNYPVADLKIERAGLIKQFNVSLVQRG